MERVIVIGSPGAGKSTFARRLRDASQIPLYYLDMIWHLPDRTNVSREEFDMQLQEILAKGVGRLSKRPHGKAPRELSRGAGLSAAQRLRIRSTCSRMAAKLSALMTCSMRQASSAATLGSTPRAVSQLERKVCRS